jgi:hypothetical protein
MGASAFAQTPIVNPTQLGFQHSDYNVTTRYELGYYYPTATEPFQTVSILPNTINLNAGEYQTSLPRPAFGTFISRLRACAPAQPTGEACSDWSNVTQSYRLAPLAPANLIVR